MMTPSLIARYQSGGDIYVTLSQKYGADVANNVAAAAASGDETVINAAIPGISTGRISTPLDTSTLDIFSNFIVSDPLAAPLAGANTALQNSFFALLKSPFVLLAVAGVIFFALGGGGWLRKKLNA